MNHSMISPDVVLANLNPSLWLQEMARDRTAQIRKEEYDKLIRYFPFNTNMNAFNAMLRRNITLRQIDDFVAADTENVRALRRLHILNQKPMNN